MGTWFCFVQPTWWFGTECVLYQFCSIWHNWTGAWHNQQNDLCVQRRLQSAWTSTQFDQNLRCPAEEGLGQTHKAHVATTLVRLVFAVRTGYFVSFVVLRLILYWYHLTWLLGSCWIYGLISWHSKIKLTTLKWRRGSVKKKQQPNNKEQLP